MRIMFFIGLLLVGVSLSLFLGGCAAFDTPFTPEFDRGPNVKKKYFYLAKSDELETVCGKSEKTLLGCAVVPRSPDDECLIYLYANGPADTKLHEEKHCRYGKWHR